MGLDVYLYKYENKTEADRLEQEYETASEANWNEAGGYKSLSDEGKEVVRAKNKSLAESLGLCEWGIDEKNKLKVEIDSQTQADHLFKIGYFRSSYNNGGINRILENLQVPGLYEIFEPNDEYCFQPNWQLALEKCSQSISLLETKGNYMCFDVSPNLFSKPNCASEKEALELFMKEKEREGGPFLDSYSNINGHFNLKKPLKVFALIPGTHPILKIDTPCTYVITEGENAWYLTALKIVKETIEYVLAQKDIEKYYLHWSS